MTFGMFNVDYEQRAYNPERMRKNRLERAHAALKKHGLGSMLVYDYDTWRYLGYYTRHNYARRRPGNFLLLIKDAGFPYGPRDQHYPTDETELMPWYDGKLILDKMYRYQAGCAMDPAYAAKMQLESANEILDLLKKHGVQDEPCGIDYAGCEIVDACRKIGIDIVDGNRATAEARMIKNEDEIECHRTAGAITEAAHWELCRALKPGMTEWQMAGVIAKALYDHGAEELEGPSFVICTGARSSHNVPAMPSDRIVRPGDMVIIDINGVSFQGYRTCYYRTYVVGDKPTEFQKKVYADCLACQLAMQESIKPGLTNHEITANYMAKGDKPGLWGRPPKWPAPGKYFAAHGHQLGLDSGDPGPPWNTSHDPDQPAYTIEENMVFAVEVGLYTWDGKNWAYDGVKLENTGVVRKDGWESFYRFPINDLIACGLPGEY